MNATKRKFNTLLQGIGTRSSPQAPSDATNNGPVDNNKPHRDDPFASPSLDRMSSASSSTRPASSVMAPAPVSSITSDFLAKRRRVGVLGSTTGNESSAGKTTVTNVALKKWTPGSYGDTTNTSARTEPPKYCPGDREQLIRRLATFQELTEWTPKPDKVNEIEWAKRGWVCQGKERVRCTLCNKELVVKANKREVDGKELPVLVGSEIEEAMVKKFAELVVEAHQDDCLWRKRGCDDSLLRLQITSPQTALPALRQRYDDLCTRPTFLPYLFNLRLPQLISLETIKSQLPPNFFSETPLPAVNDVALALALTGWQGLTNPRIGPVPNTASCATCLRRLGLWMFKSKEVDEATGDILVPAPMDHLDPVREHRFFCPWRNAAAQRNPGSKAAEAESKAAWEILSLTVRNDAYVRGQSTRGSSPKKTPGHGRSKSSVDPGTLSRESGHASSPSEGALQPPLLMLESDVLDDEEDDKQRDIKDKERWARLRRVKSLFDTKNGRKLRRTPSRPGTAASRPDTAKSTVTPGAAE